MKDDDTTKNARKELEKLSREGGLSAGPAIRSQAKSVRDHFKATDVDQEDRIEVLGTRIARILAVIGFVALASWLYYRYFR